MSNRLYTELSWLPKPLATFSAQIKGLPEGDVPIGQELRHLASYGLDENKLNRLAKVIEAERGKPGRLDPLVPFRLGILSNATSHFLVPTLTATAARHGFALQCIEADYGQVMQEALSADSSINRAPCDAVLIALDYRGLPLTATPADASSAEHAIDDALAFITTLRRSIRQLSGATCIVQSIARPPESLFGSFDLSLPGTLRHVIDEFNRQLAAQLHASDDALLDTAALAETLGLADWHDAALWHLAKIPFANAFLPIYSESIARLIAAMRGKSRRCLILDLDNTLWSGVIGDDGLEGIVLGQGDATGEAHQHLQRVVLQLRERGLVLAVSSKNNDETARRAFREHPEMVLREEHIAVFQANWNDKASNIQAIARELELGLDAMVFLDDNPAERALIRRLLPEVAVPELPDDAALYARTLSAAGYFESVAYSIEDRQRADFYQDNARRVSLKDQSGDLESYLQSLNMTIQFQHFDALGRARIAQLIAKSNQFNLTTRRYTESQVAALEEDDAVYTLQVRLSDVFGDNGMISLVVCKPVGDAWEIDLWLMSCRVLGRKVEDAVLQEIVQSALTNGVSHLVGVYRPTGRNQLVQDHYAKLGFSMIQAGSDGQTRWELNLKDFPLRALPMTVVRTGQLEPA